MTSNKTLALVILATVIVSLGGTLLSLNKLSELEGLRIIQEPEPVTGAVVSPGALNFSISSAASCEVERNVSFGSGSSASELLLSTDAANGGGFNDCTSNSACYGLEINNTGNVVINVSMESQYDGSEMLGAGGADEDFNYSARNGSYAGTFEGCNETLTSSVTQVSSTLNQSLCGNFSFSPSANLLTVEFNVSVEPIISAGAHGSYITINCGEI